MASFAFPGSAQVLETEPETYTYEEALIDPIFNPPEVLLVGDSWAFYMFLDRTLSRLFDKKDLGHLNAAGARTARSGSTARRWTRPDYLERIDQALAKYPEIEVIQLTLGGNDLLAGRDQGGWYAGMSPEQEAALAQRILGDLDVILSHIHERAPDVHVLLSLYDYPNFVETLDTLGSLLCSDLWEGLNRPIPREINAAAQRFEALAGHHFSKRPWVSWVPHLGTMQSHYGYPSMDIEPGQISRPGNLELPSPPEAMRYWGQDCFHLSKRAYDQLAENLWRDFYFAWFGGGLFSDNFEGGTASLWSQVR